MGYSDAIATTVALIEDALLDALTANHVIANTVGQTLHMIRNAAIAGSTLNSLMDKIRGATSGQIFASAGVVRTFDNARFTMTASQTLDIIPAAGQSCMGMILGEDGGGPTDTVRISADSGVNYRIIKDIQGITDLNSGDATFIIEGIGNSTGRIRIVCDATVNTRTYFRMFTLEA